MRFVFHMLDMAIVNSWKLYRRDAEDLNLPEKDILSLASFKLSVANALLQKGKAQTGKRGRPFSDSQRTIKKRARSGPENIIRFDQTGHFLVLEEKRNRCKNSECTGKTRYACKKCKVNLCITVTSNCFSAYHEE